MATLAEMTPEAAEARREYRRRYRAANREKINAYQREYFRKHPEKRSAYQAAYWDRLAGRYAKENNDTSTN